MTEDRAADALREKVHGAATAYLSLYGLPANAPIPFDPPTYKAIAARIGPLCADAVLAALDLPALLAAERERVLREWEPIHQGILAQAVREARVDALREAHRLILGLLGAPAPGGLAEPAPGEGASRG